MREILNTAGSAGSGSEQSAPSITFDMEATDKAWVAGENTPSTT
jgi:hypothetical protein